MENSDDGISLSYEFDGVVDLPTTLEDGSIEHLGVDDQQTVVIHQRAIFIITAGQGDLTASEAVEIELWEPPADNTSHEPAELIDALVDEFMTFTDASLRT